MKSIQVLLLCIAVILSMASANGVAEEQNKDRTGSPDGSNTCTQCHTGGGFNPQLSIQVEDLNGEMVSSYVSGETYNLKFMVTSIPFPTVYGFQATALFDDLSDAGEFLNPGTGVQLEEVNTPEIPSRHIIEHSNPGFVGNFQAQWIAPMSEEDVIFYAAAVTANGNNEPEGDKATNHSMILPAAAPDDLVTYEIDRFELRILSDAWIIEHPFGMIADEIHVYDLSGNELMNEVSKTSIDPSGLKDGFYLISIILSDQVKCFKILNI